MLPLVLLLAAADPSPTLQAIVALGRGNTPEATTTTTTPTPTPPPATTTTTTPESTTTTPTTPTTPRWATAKEEPSPWGGVAALLALCGGAGALWWRKRGGAGAQRILRLQETVAVGKGRALIVADVDGRRVLLSSSEAGISLLLDLGTPQTTTLDTAPPKKTTRAADSTAPISNDAFADALAAEMTPVTVSGIGGNVVDVEGGEIQRRLELARRAS